MKNTFLFYFVLSLTFLSCSNESIDDQDINNTEVSLTNYIYKTYNVSNAPNTIIDSANYLINANKIISSSGLNLETLTQLTSNYNYLDGKIDNIKSFSNGALIRIQSFSYNTNNDLVEYLTESINTQNQNSSFQKHSFNHTTDTIFSSWTRSADGVNFDEEVSDFKIVLDDNVNRTYIETYSHLNDAITFEINSYDASNNIINESKYLRLDNGNDVLSFENNYTTNSSENLFNRINEATYTRKTLMLLHHLQSNAINNINAKRISGNVLTNYQSTWGNSFADFEISNIMDDTGTTLFSEFKTTIGGDLLSRFTQEYIFQ
jgi:hypothetical protein